MSDPRYEERERQHGFIRVRFRLIPADEGGRRKPIFSDYRASWDIGNTHKDEWGLNDAPLTLEDVEVLHPGQVALARLHPAFFPAFWSAVGRDREIHAHEGTRRVGSAVVLEVVPPSNGA